MIAVFHLPITEMRCLFDIEATVPFVWVNSPFVTQDVV